MMVHKGFLSWEYVRVLRVYVVRVAAIPGIKGLIYHVALLSSYSLVHFIIDDCIYFYFTYSCIYIPFTFAGYYYINNYKNKYTCGPFIVFVNFFHWHVSRLTPWSQCVVNITLKIHSLIFMNIYIFLSCEILFYVILIICHIFGFFDLFKKLGPSVEFALC
jgi:hypothetical protein